LHVKFTDPDVGIVYGSCDRYSDAGKRAEAKGLVRITEAITGTAYVVSKSAVTGIPNSIPVLVDGRWGYSDEYSKFIDAEFEKAKAVSDAVPGFGVGALLQIGVADGYAYYLVTAVNKRTAKVIWRGYSMDGWQCRVLGAGGTFPRAHLERLRKV
jgi:hypothetical protein